MCFAIVFSIISKLLTTCWLL